MTAMFLPFGEKALLYETATRGLIFQVFTYSSFLWRDVSREISDTTLRYAPFRGRWPQASASVWLVYLFSLRSNVLEPSNFDSAHTTDANGKYFSQRRSKGKFHSTLRCNVYSPVRSFLSDINLSFNICYSSSIVSTKNSNNSYVCVYIMMFSKRIFKHWIKFTKC